MLMAGPVSHTATLYIDFVDFFTFHWICLPFILLILGTDHYFFIRGVTIFGTCRQFFLRLMHFKQFFSLHFVMETIFLQPFLKNVTGFFIDLI